MSVKINRLNKCIARDYGGKVTNIIVNQPQFSQKKCEKKLTCNIMCMNINKKQEAVFIGSLFSYKSSVSVFLNTEIRE